MPRKIITAPSTRQEMLKRLRDIKRLATNARKLILMDAETLCNVPARVNLDFIINHCEAARKALEPWRNKQWPT